MQHLLGQGSCTKTVKDGVLTIHKVYCPLQYLKQYQGISKPARAPHRQLPTIGKSLIISDRFHNHTGTWTKVHYNRRTAITPTLYCFGAERIFFFQFFSSLSCNVIVCWNNHGRNYPVHFIFFSYFFLLVKCKIKIYLPSHFVMLVTESKFHHFPLVNAGFLPNGS